MHVQHAIDKEFIRCFGHTRYRYQLNVMEQMSHEYKIGPHVIEQPSEQSALESLQWCIAFGYAVLSKVLTGSLRVDQKILLASLQYLLSDVLGDQL